MSNKLLDGIGKAVLPNKFRPKIRKYLQRSGIYEIPYSAFGILFWISALVTLTIFIFSWNIIKSQDLSTIALFALVLVGWFIVHLLTAFVIMGLTYFYFDYKIYIRTREIENVLPDFLNVFSENLRSGMPTDKALWRAVKPEFGVLANEIRIASKQVMTGKGIEQALDEFSQKYDSPTLNRSLKLIVEGMKSGSEIAPIIDKVVDDIKNTTDLKKKMAANAFAFMIFITVIVILIAPALFALSQNLLIILESFIVNLQTSGVASAKLPISFEQIAIEPDQFFMFSQAALVIISFFSSLIISIINKGEIKAGIKYIPLFVLCSISAHYMFVELLKYVFGGFFV